jgi:hypothetical protein
MTNLTKHQKEIVAAGLSSIANKGIQSLLIRNVAKNRAGILEPAIYAAILKTRITFCFISLTMSAADDG